MAMFRHLMPAKVRSNAGCWTCRIRRKKCDEHRPICDGCRSLEITCHFDDQKPVWMDGGPRQKEMGDRIKAQVKKQASQRRDRKYMGIIESATENVRLDDGSAGGGGGAAAYGAQEAESKTDLYFCRETSVSVYKQTRWHHDFGLTPPSSHSSSGASPPEMMIPSPPDRHTATAAHPESGPDVDLHFTMIYLDYVFPYLFPYYRPPILSGGRGWVLDILHSNKSVYYTAISLASYFFGVLLSNGDKSHEECTARMAGKLQGQLEMGLKELQKDMRAINNLHYGSGDGGSFNIYDGLLTMQSILQMVVFEVATANGDNWKMHLDAALAMFFKILPDPQKWPDTLRDLYTTRWPPPQMGVRRPWSTNQAAFRFFTAHLLHLDVMSSAALQRAPRLASYHNVIIPVDSQNHSGEHCTTTRTLLMDDFVGVNNHITHMIGQIATLDAWKKDQQAAGTLSTEELASRGRVMATTVTACLESVERQCHEHAAAQSIIMSSMIVEDPLPDMHHQKPSRNEWGFRPSMVTQNKIWLRAVSVYLCTVVLGWQPQNPAIREHVAAMTEILTGLPESAVLRGMVWPFCVAGCLSPPEDEDKYRAVLGRLGCLEVFGTTKEASDIMEKVWSCRGQMDESWDLARCLGILGHRSLLI